jgi:hypothetical protein
MAMTMKITIFWDVTLQSGINLPSFGSTHCLHLQGRKWRQYVTPMLVHFCKTTKNYILVDCSLYILHSSFKLCQYHMINTSVLLAPALYNTSHTFQLNITEKPCTASI